VLVLAAFHQRAEIRPLIRWGERGEVIQVLEKAFSTKTANFGKMLHNLFEEANARAVQWEVAQALDEMSQGPGLVWCGT
jgi:aminoglycoside phosphotransferase family enzyme